MSPLAPVARAAAYAIVIAILLELIVRTAGGGGGEAATAENGPVEIGQCVAALAAGGLFTLAARASAARADLLYMLALASVFAGARELDRVFKHLVAEGAHKLVGVVIAIAAATIAWRARGRLIRQLEGFVRTAPAMLLFAACVVILVFAQIVGQQGLWRGLMGDGYIWQVKRAVEEISELLGYLLLLFAAVETWLLERPDP